MIYKSLRKGLAVLASVALLTPSSSPAQVVCANCSTELTQLLNYAQLIDQLAKQASILETNLNQYRNMTTNTTPLTSTQWGSALSDINTVNQLLGQATSLSYAAGNIDSQFSNKYSDYNNYLAGQLTTQTFAAKYQQWSSDTNSSVKTTLRGAGQQSSQIQTGEESTLQNLETQVTGVQGNLDALQVNSEIAMQTVRQLQKLRQLVAMDVQLKANFIQTIQDRESAQAAAWRKFVTSPSVPTQGGGRF